MKKFISLVLCMALVFGLTGTAFAGEKDEMQTRSNRYYFTVEQGTEKVIGVKTFTAAEIANQSNKRTIINMLASIVSVQFAGAGQLASETWMQANGYGTATKVNISERYDTRYQVDRLTGKKTKVERKYFLIHNLYVTGSDGKFMHYKKSTQSFTLK